MLGNDKGGRGGKKEEKEGRGFTTEQGNEG